MKAKTKDAEPQVSVIDKLRASVSDKELERVSKVAKTHKGRKILKAREAQEVEEPKTSVLLKGSNCPQFISNVLRSLHKMRDPELSIYRGHKKNSIYPFDDVTKIENICAKSESGLFVFGNS
jgi:ribosome production factor 2